jgi:hypothetical protein
VQATQGVSHLIIWARLQVVVEASLRHAPGATRALADALAAAAARAFRACGFAAPARARRRAAAASDDESGESGGASDVEGGGGEGGGGSDESDSGGDASDGSDASGREGAPPALTWRDVNLALMLSRHASPLGTSLGAWPRLVRPPAQELFSPASRMTRIPPTTI